MGCACGKKKGGDIRRFTTEDMKEFSRNRNIAVKRGTVSAKRTVEPVSDSDSSKN